MMKGEPAQTGLAPDMGRAVRALKTAILRAQSRAAADANRELLSLYFGIGRFVSLRTRTGVWGSGAIEAISGRLQRELPGLRGFSATNMRYMRLFYEAWETILIWPPAAAKLPNAPSVEPLTEIHQPMADELANLPATQALTEIRQPLAGELTEVEIIPLSAFRQPLADDLNLAEFLSLGFSHHMEILAKTTTLDERLYYIQQAAANRWTKLELRTHLAANDFVHAGKMPSNFAATIPDPAQARRALAVFKDEYLLDFINVEELDLSDPADIDERVVEQAIVAHIRRFILTFGRDFSFISNQYRLEAAGHELFVDLLFFNRELNALVAVELKQGEFKPAYLGQLHLYLQALDEQTRKPHENPPIGIILCKSADRAFVEYAVRDYTQPMGVATYKTASEMPEHLRRSLPDMDELRRQLENPQA